ncbi:MAG: acetate kinase [Clostridiaceae bacterium]|nr:acetate kinase [Clostridiaceae bacterium]
MIILVINAGSSSLKYQLLDTVSGEALARGVAERIGLDASQIKHTKNNGEPVRLLVDMPSHREAIQEVLQVLTAAETGVISGMDAIDAVGHRVVHGGEKFADSALITPAVKEAIRSCFVLAPLHNPPNMTGIEACEEAMPGIPEVAVFDTAFHQSMPPEAYMYAIPYDLYKKLGIRKYGFHGTSHRYVAYRAAEMLGRDIRDLRIITCHLGNGSSITAVKGGESVDTSMGMTPLAGISMGTRSGDIDPAIAMFLMEREKLNAQQVDDILNKKSGMLGISGISSDFRDLYAASDAGNERATLALDIFKYHCRKTIGAYAAAMGGVDVVVFTAGVGENNDDVRQGACEGLAFMGIEIDPAKNSAARAESDISVDGSRVRVLVVPTNEELAIATETARICCKS